MQPHLRISAYSAVENNKGAYKPQNYAEKTTKYLRALRFLLFIFFVDFCVSCGYKCRPALPWRLGDLSEAGVR